MSNEAKREDLQNESLKQMNANAKFISDITKYRDESDAIMRGGSNVPDYSKNINKFIDNNLKQAVKNTIEIYDNLAKNSPQEISDLNAQKEKTINDLNKQFADVFPRHYTTDRQQELRKIVDSEVEKAKQDKLIKEPIKNKGIRANIKKLFVKLTDKLADAIKARRKPVNYAGEFKIDNNAKPTLNNINKSKSADNIVNSSTVKLTIEQKNNVMKEANEIGYLIGDYAKGIKRPTPPPSKPRNNDLTEDVKNVRNNKPRKGKGISY